MEQKLLKTISEAAFSELIIAIGLVFILGVISTATSVMTAVSVKRQILTLNKQEGFYAGELAAWHFYFKNNGSSQPCSSHAGSGGRCIVSITNETIANETGQNEYHPDSYQPGVPLPLSTTRSFDSHNTILRRYTGDNVAIKTLPRTDSVSFCGEMSFSVRAKTFSMCLVRPPEKPSGNFKLEHIGFKEIPFRVTRLFNVRHFAVQNDGKIVIVGSDGDVDHMEGGGSGGFDGHVWRLMRLMPDGSIDRTFGDWGYAESYGNRRGMTAHKVEILPDGKIVVAGIANGEGNARHLVVARYLSSGEMDSSFGESGLAWPPITPANAHIYTPVLALGSNGAILVGVTQLVGGISSFLARLNSNGSVDKSFGKNGWAEYDFIDGMNDYLQSIAWFSDGKILLAGHSSSSAKYGYYWVVRLLSDGTLDSSFGIAGKAIVDLSNTCKWGNVAPAMTIHKDSIFVGGSCGREREKNIISTDPILLKWTKEGTPDTSFGGVGNVVLDLGHAAVDSTATIIKGIIGLDNNSLLAVGRGGPKYQHVTFWKILSNGTLDSTFGKNGELYHKNILFHKKDMPLGGAFIADDTHYPVPVTSIRELSGGKILVAGGVYHSAHFFVSRHHLNADIDTSFATEGIFKGSLPITYAQGSSVVIQNDGMTVVGGFANPSVPFDSGYPMPLLARISPKLEFDSTFGGKIQDVCYPLDYQSADGLPGRVNTCPSKTVRAFWDYALDVNGKILGTGSFGGGPPGIGLGRYQTDGSLDKNFGVGGTIGDSYPSYAGAGMGGAKAVLPLPDGKMIVVSTMWTGSDDPRVIGILRFHSSGSLDNSFGDKGLVSTDFNTLLPEGYVRAQVEVTTASLQSDGKIVVVGYITLVPASPGPNNMPNVDFLIARFLATGVLDTTFGKRGYERIDFKDLAPKEKRVPGMPPGTPEDSYDYGFALLIESGGKILVGGHSTIMGTSGVFSTISRFDAQGVLDPSFGNRGRVLEDIHLGPEKNDFTDRDCVKGLIALPGGRFMAAISFGTMNTALQGSYDKTKTQNNIFYIVYGSDGTREKSFGENGVLRFLPGDFVTVIEDIATRGDLISAAGTAIHSPWDHNFIVDMWRIVPE